MTTSTGLIATVADVERIERKALPEQYQTQNTYDLLRQSAAQHGAREALVFVPKGTAEEPPFVYTYAALLRRVTARQLLGAFAVACEVS